MKNIIPLPFFRCSFSFAPIRCLMQLYRFCFTSTAARRFHRLDPVSFHSTHVAMNGSKSGLSSFVHTADTPALFRWLRKTHPVRRTDAALSNFSIVLLFGADPHL
jgi:hypothetical protein